MKVLAIWTACGLLGVWSFLPLLPTLELTQSATLDSLGACQGLLYRRGKAYLYGDREVGMMREYDVKTSGLVYTGREYRFTQAGKDVINHPTGIACNGTGPTFIGNSIRLNPEGTAWRAVIYCIDWSGLLKTGTLDGNLLNTIEDDACVQGTRPEYVRYRNKEFVATADYGNKANAVRLYDPERLRTARKTSEPGVLVHSFRCTPWVQNLHWIPEKQVLVLIQNQIEGRKWRFTFVDLPRSIESGTQQVLGVVDTDQPDELEGFALTGDPATGVAVTSSRTRNVHYLRLGWR